MFKKIALVLLAVLPISLMAQDTKLGHVNFQEIYRIMPEQVGVQKALEDQSKEFETYLTKMNEEYTTKLKDYTDKQATMSESIKQVAVNELQDLQQRITTFRQTASTDLDKKQQELQAPIVAKINKAIGEVAAEGKYLYIFNYIQEVFLYQAPSANDITPLVKKKLALDKPVEAKKPAAAETKKAATPAETKAK